MGKIITKGDFREIRKQLRLEGKKIAHCHGVFDLVHPGHLQHFKEAKKMADVLVVTVTAAKYVRKGPGRPYFDDDIRIDFLSAIEYIDYVILSDGYTGEDVIEVIQPDYWVKGMEYADKKNDITKVQDQEVALVRKYGGDIRFTSGIQFSSSYLLNKTIAPFSEELQEYILNLKKSFSLDKAIELMDRLKNLSVLVIGDAIIDEYIYCVLSGEMTKSMGYSTRIIRKERFLGGSLAIARHAASFSDKVTLLSVIGKEHEVLEEIKQELNKKIENRLIYSEKFNTIVKTKYLVENEKREELVKIFSVNNVKSPAIIPEESQEELLDILKRIIKNYDLVICCDFGHGLIEEETIRFLEKSANYLVVNCQTNATNQGMNLITKYKKVDAFTLNQRELRLALQTDRGTEEINLFRLKELLHAREGWLTRGSSGAYGISENVISCPAVSTRVKDTIGAGDAFLTMAALVSAVGEDIAISTFLGNVAGALGANIVGNSQSIERNNVLKFVATLLNI